VGVEQGLTLMTARDVMPRGPAAPGDGCTPINDSRQQQQQQQGSLHFIAAAAAETLAKVKGGRGALHELPLLLDTAAGSEADQQQQRTSQHAAAGPQAKIEQDQQQLPPGRIRCCLTVIPRDLMKHHL